jgi:hypothetical protein
MALFCAQKTALVLAYRDSAAKYGLAVTELHDRIGTVPRETYERMHNGTEEARPSVESARLAVEEHVRGHGC